MRVDQGWVVGVKPPIEIRDIRKGDLIRAEWDSPGGGLTAVEFIGHRDGFSLYMDAPNHFLLDRPEPAVKLPISPTLGWADGRLGFWNGWQNGLNGRFANGGVANGDWPSSFVYATVVPTAALDELRNARHQTLGDINRAAKNFLAAVDKANA